MRPAILLAYVPQSISRAAAIKFVDRDNVGKIDHVDFFKLTGSAILTGHYIDGHINMLGDCHITLTNADSLDKNQVKAAVLTQGNGIRQARRDFTPTSSCGKGAHIEPRARQRIHANTVAKER